MTRRIASILAAGGLVALAALPAPALAQKGDFVPKPNTYLCPNIDGTGAVDCFLDAVEHLYTMCRQVKSIEIIEFGYEKSEEGVNAAKSEYCVDKHKLTMTRPYQAALREATGSSRAIDRLRELHEHWLQSLHALKWKPGESDDDYKARITRPYEAFKERAAAVREAIQSKLKVKTAAAKPEQVGGSKAAPGAKAPAKDPTN